MIDCGRNRASCRAAATLCRHGPGRVTLCREDGPSRRLLDTTGRCATPIWPERPQDIRRYRDCCRNCSSHGDGVGKWPVHGPGLIEVKPHRRPMPDSPSRRQRPADSASGAMASVGGYVVGFSGKNGSVRANSGGLSLAGRCEDIRTLIPVSPTKGVMESARHRLGQMANRIRVHVQLREIRNGHFLGRQMADEEGYPRTKPKFLPRV